MCVTFGEWHFLSGFIAGAVVAIAALWYVAREGVN